MLVVFDFTAPYTKKDTNFYAAKIDSPTEATVHMHYLCANIKSIWLYNAITGDVYTKLKPK
jgi:hypothetical protein